MTEQAASSVIEVRASSRGLAITQRYMGFCNYLPRRLALLTSLGVTKNE